MGAEVINYPNVSSCGTATAISVPCMFSRMNRSDYNGNTAKHQEGLMDVLQRAGVYTSWRENDSGCKGACDRIKHIDIRELAAKSQCGSEGCLDMALLNGLEQEIQAMPNDGVIVLHTMGSHGPAYYERYTDEFRKLQDEVPALPAEEIKQQIQRQLGRRHRHQFLGDLPVKGLLAQTPHDYPDFFGCHNLFLPSFFADSRSARIRHSYLNHL